MAANSAIVHSDGLSRWQRRIRAPIHRIISIAERMSGSSEIRDGVELSRQLASMIQLCQESLARISAPVDTEQNLVKFAERICLDVQSEAERLVAAGVDLTNAAHEAGITDMEDDLGNLQEAAREFQQQAAELDAETLSAAVAASGEPEKDRDTVRQIDEGRRSSRTQQGLLLVVDDDADNRDVLSRRLLRDGHEVMVAEGGRQALRMLLRYPFDLVLLDIMMPDMDGHQVLTEIKRNEQLRHLPVIMVTAVDEIETVVRCIEAGADDYLTKPFNRVLLKARIDALLDRKRLRDEEVRHTQALTTMLSEIQSQGERIQGLLLNMLPKLVAEELQANGSVEPMYFEDVTVVFADIVGFTLSTEQLPADELVAILHEYFTAFDKIIDRYSLEKLKTIGDSYMYAGGVPERSPSNPVDCVLAALEIAQTTKTLAERGPVDWQVRIGINTGPVIAGVVGIKKFAFDIWGDTVNFSARMEASGKPGMVNLSAATALRVKDFFDFEKRDKVRVKEGREVDTFLVKGLGRRVIHNASGLSPQEAFGRRYRAYFRKALQCFPDYLSVLDGEAR